MTQLHIRSQAHATWRPKWLDEAEVYGFKGRASAWAGAPPLTLTWADARTLVVGNVRPSSPVGAGSWRDVTITYSAGARGVG